MSERAKDSEIPRVELDKWVYRIKESLDKAYGHDCDCVNVLEICVQACAHIDACTKRDGPSVRVHKQEYLAEAREHDVMNDALGTTLERKNQ